MSETPPRRSRPRRVWCVAMTTRDPASRPTTSSRTKMLRRRSVIGSLGSLFRRREHEEQPAVVVVGGEEVGGGAGRQIALRVDLHGLVQRSYTPFEDRVHGILPVGPSQAEHHTYRAADDALVVEARQLEGTAAAPDDATLGVAHEERGVRGRVVVVEQLEQEGKSALAARGRLARESARALRFVRSRTTVRADEEVSHALSTGYALVRHPGVSWTTCADARRNSGGSAQARVRDLPRSQKSAAASDGASRPRCAYARAVAARPRGVRCNRPHCRRYGS